MASQEATPADPVPSKRWTQFYAALQLAIQRAARKWTFVLLFFPTCASSSKVSFSRDLILSRYKDFSECFPLWCEEQPSGAEGVFNTVSNFIETHIVVRALSLSLSLSPTSPTHSLFFRSYVRLPPPGEKKKNKNNTNKLFEEYDVQKNLDTLHQVVTEARERRQRSEPPPGGSGSGIGSGKDNDLWRADLQPRAAVRAQTVPALERERDALRARLADVRPTVPFLFFSHFISEFFTFPSLPCPSREPTLPRGTRTRKNPDADGGWLIVPSPSPLPPLI